MNKKLALFMFTLALSASAFATKVTPVGPWDPDSNPGSGTGISKQALCISKCYNRWECKSIFDRFCHDNRNYCVYQCKQLKG
jgi:hypothetical protein